MPSGSGQIAGAASFYLMIFKIGVPFFPLSAFQKPFAVPAQVRVAYRAFYYESAAVYAHVSSHFGHAAS